MAIFPSSVYTFPTYVDNVNYVTASMFNGLGTELTAVSSSLGVNFTGSFTVLSSLWAVGHKASGDHDNFVFGEGTIKAELNTTNATTRILHNCTETTGTFSAYDSSTCASMIEFNTTGQVRVEIKSDTTSTWTSFGKAIALINSSDLTTLYDLSLTGSNGVDLTIAEASKFSHAITTKSIAFSAMKFVPDDIWGGIVFDATALIIYASAADNAFDYGATGIELPIGATITGMTIYGSSASGANNQVVVSLHKILNVSPFTTTVVASTYMSNGDTSKAASFSSDVVVNTHTYSLLASIKADGGTAADTFLVTTKITYTTTDMSQTI